MMQDEWILGMVGCLLLTRPSEPGELYQSPPWQHDTGKDRGAAQPYSEALVFRTRLTARSSQLGEMLLDLMRPDLCRLEFGDDLRRSVGADNRLVHAACHDPQNGHVRHQPTSHIELRTARLLAWDELGDLSPLRDSRGKGERLYSLARGYRGCGGTKTICE
ncbi:MAG: hypothetical protein H7247_01930 [Polaromonas sp.]|nr:hypothetical protein [Gemmatimonadaceae bacterium]